MFNHSFSQGFQHIEKKITELLKKHKLNKSAIDFQNTHELTR